MKKIILGLGAITTAIVPAIAAGRCGNVVSDVKAMTEEIVGQFSKEQLRVLGSVMGDLQNESLTQVNPLVSKTNHEIAFDEAKKTLTFNLKSDVHNYVDASVQQSIIAFFNALKGSQVTLNINIDGKHADFKLNVPNKTITTGVFAKEIASQVELGDLANHITISILDAPFGVTIVATSSLELVDFDDFTIDKIIVTVKQHMGETLTFSGSVNKQDFTYAVPAIAAADLNSKFVRDVILRKLIEHIA